MNGRSLFMCRQLIKLNWQFVVFFFSVAANWNLAARGQNICERGNKTMKLKKKNCRNKSKAIFHKWYFWRPFSCLLNVKHNFVDIFMVYFYHSPPSFGWYIFFVAQYNFFSITCLRAITMFNVFHDISFYYRYKPNGKQSKWFLRAMKIYVKL